MDWGVLCLIVLALGAGWIILTLLLSKLMLYVAYGHTRARKEK